jgi:transcriptional regulator with XRE-family HTH domain
MILNALQYRVSKAAAEKFRIALAGLTQAPSAAGVAPALAAAERRAIRAQLVELERDIDHYERLARGEVDLSGTLRELGPLLVAARTVRGWTQAELGTRLGLSRQQIHRYEASQYEGAALRTILAVAQAIGITTEISMDLVKLPDMPPNMRAAFRLPNSTETMTARAIQRTGRRTPSPKSGGRHRR